MILRLPLLTVLAATVHALAFHPNGRILASAGPHSDIRLLDIATGETIALVKGTQIPHALAISGDGAFLSTGCGDGSVRLYRLGARGGKDR